ncbi:Pet127-domain-containing protein [Coemansia reversa NRRL 1564]|uniref:Pet127-domain-containing protein n=1 Tax=Coemansia reversa (strain ATCC 12441 / NRRL 1564) TaxID=763665 RepID=A0A2G5B603_COERN|nr:Pet127-domain-containing protein [Coemansia reversa NRRL 1564]|eukprot:PIA14473.1 Pet127-domain-containing protein [Coemansia reversa NRRL 1564]
MTHVLSHLYFAISGGKQPNVSCLSMKFADMPNRFTRGMRYPASIALRYHDGVYGIDADKSFDVKDSILSILGKSLEKLLTSTPKEFEKYKKENSWKVKNIPEETYHYATFGDFALRSQLDCRDPRLPRRSFDLKTRGSLAVRMDLENYEVSKGYQINTMKGRLQSFEREYYDMARSAFLKYNFQTRIGNMDGIFVAYHNTARMFGFQYISRREMDEVLYGNEATGNKAFKAVLILLGNMLRTVTDQYPKRDIRVTFDSHGASGNLDMWVEIINDKEEAVAAQQYQNTGQFTTSTRRGTDPFSSPDPLDASLPNASNKTNAAEELTEEDIDPADDIYINTEHPIIHYTLETFSTFNDQDTNEPVTLRSGNDEWFVNFALKKSLEDPETLAQQYRNLRLRQSTYFERASPDTPDEELYPLVRILRRISRREMWKNDLPAGKFIVNRSRPPIYGSDSLKIQKTPKVLKQRSSLARRTKGELLEDNPTTSDLCNHIAWFGSLNIVAMYRSSFWSS